MEIKASQEEAEKRKISRRGRGKKNAWQKRRNESWKRRTKIYTGLQFSFAT